MRRRGTNQTLHLITVIIWNLYAVLDITLQRLFNICSWIECPIKCYVQYCTTLYTHHTIYT